MSTQKTSQNSASSFVVEDPPLAKFLFGDVRLSWLWLILRVYVGFNWLQAGIEKFQSPAWFGDKAGSAIAGFATGALAKSTGDHPDVSGWYASFLQHVVLSNPALWSYVITFGETLVGIGLILGIFTGIAAFFGSFMNVNYLLAGTVSTNPLLFIIATWLVLSWKTAGWLGLDHWLLPAVGTPWRPGKLFQKSSRVPQEE